MNKKNESDLLFERYLTSQNLEFSYEPVLGGTTRLVDYVVPFGDASLYFEVKQIEVPLPEGSGQWHPYPPVRSHIHDGVKQFKGLPDTINALVFAAGPNSFIDLMRPDVMLGAMYGDLVFTFPIDTKTGKGDHSQGRWTFARGKGKMIHKGGIQNTRISALLSLHNHRASRRESDILLRTSGKRAAGMRSRDLQAGETNTLEDPVPFVTLWENAFAKKRFPDDLFRGPMDARWSFDGELQSLTFVGARRARLGLDKP